MKCTECSKEDPTITELTLPYCDECWLKVCHKAIREKWGVRDIPEKPADYDPDI